jgi:hypothetical protein
VAWAQVSEIAANDDFKPYAPHQLVSATELCCIPSIWSTKSLMCEETSRNSGLVRNFWRWVVKRMRSMERSDFGAMAEVVARAATRWL